MVRRPQNQIAVSNKIKNATNEFIQRNQRYPSAEELSDIISMEIDKIEKAIQWEAYFTRKKSKSNTNPEFFLKLIIEQKWFMIGVCDPEPCIGISDSI